MISPALYPAPLAAAVLKLTAVLVIVPGLMIPVIPPALAEGTWVTGTHCSLFGGKGP